MNVDKKNIVLVDFDIDGNWSFLKTLESVTHDRWEVKRHATNHPHGVFFQTSCVSFGISFSHLQS